MKVMTIFGTRPEMIKLWSTTRLIDALGLDHVMVHTGQNFTPEMREFIFKDLGMRAPDHQLGISTASYAQEVADVVVQCDALMERHRPDALIILGDTYSGLSVLPAAHRGIRILHMEAGLRAFDRRMPEQRNRVLIDHMSSVCLPFHDRHRENLLREGIHPTRIYVTGNPTFEAMDHIQEAVGASDVVERMGLAPRGYAVATGHRAEIVNEAASRDALLRALGRLADALGVPVVYPMHPRTRSKIGDGPIPDGVRACAPLGFIDFNRLVRDAAWYVSDSGTAAEEGMYYGVPFVSLRTCTERPETVEAGGQTLGGLDPARLVAAVRMATAAPAPRLPPRAADDAPSRVVCRVLLSEFVNHF